MWPGDAQWRPVLTKLGISFTERSTGVFVILCPFHKERTPSMHLWPRSGRYHCHGCHSGGTIEEFVLHHGLPLDRFLRAPLNDPNQLLMESILPAKH